MKILFYNLGYGRGITGSWGSYVRKGSSLLYQKTTAQQRTLNGVINLVLTESPDVFTYAEISLGSFRNQYFNQHEYLNYHLSDNHAGSSASKYGESVFSSLPFHLGNGNGALSFVPADISTHYLKKSRKKLIIIVKTQEVTIFSVHLPLVSADRRAQLEELVELVNECVGDVVVCGDFNIFGGINELEYIVTHTNMQLAGERVYTFPSHSPKIELDVFLYRFCDEQKKPTFKVIESTLSDHLPILLEW